MYNSINKEYYYKEGDNIYKIILSKIPYDDLAIYFQKNCDIPFSTRKNLKYLFKEYEWIQTFCDLNDSDNLFKLIDNSFDNDRIEINVNEMNYSEIKLRIFLFENMNYNITFSLKSNFINNMNNNIVNYPLSSYYNNNFNFNQSDNNNYSLNINEYNNTNNINNSRYNSTNYYINDIYRNNNFCPNNNNYNNINLNNYLNNEDNNRNINNSSNIISDNSNYIDNYFNDNNNNNSNNNNCIPNNIDTNVYISNDYIKGNDNNRYINNKSIHNNIDTNSYINDYFNKNINNEEYTSKDMENPNETNKIFPNLNITSIQVTSNNPQYITLFNTYSFFSDKTNKTNINELLNIILDNSQNNSNQTNINNNIVMKIKLLQPTNNNNIIKKEEKEEEKELNGLLRFFLLKRIANFLSENELTKENKIIFDSIRNKIFFTGEKNHNLKDMIKQNNFYDILSYSDYLNKKNSLIEKEIKRFFENEKEKIISEEIHNYLSILSEYTELNKSFEIQFRKDLKNSKFDYILVGLNILERDNPEEYKNKSNENMKKCNLYMTSNISPESYIIEDELKYPKNLRCAITLTDEIDYLACFLNQNGNNKGKIIPINKNFSLVVSQIFFDKNKCKKIKNIDLDKIVFDHNPSYDELKMNYRDRMVEPNGIHIIKIKENNNYEDLNNSNIEKEEEKDLANEYLITEKYQIFPFYHLTLKRNEYFVLFRDSNFNEKNEYFDLLENIKLSLNINIYYEKTIEEALKFLLIRKYNKIILITTIEKDLSGKRFIDIARKILGLDIIVLFYSNSEDSKEHFSWLQKYSNCLFTNKAEKIAEYIKNYNEEGLKELKKKLESENNITLKQFSFDFLQDNIIIDNFSSLDFTCRYIKQAYIKIGNEYLYMKRNGKVVIDSKDCKWDITFYNNEITLFSNGFYLNIKEDKENVIGSKLMKEWHFEQINKNYYYFQDKEKENNNILSVEDNEIKVNKEMISENEKFQLIETFEQKKDINSESILSFLINDELSSISLSD